MADDEITIDLRAGQPKKVPGGVDGRDEELAQTIRIRSEANDLLRGNISFRNRGPENQAAAELWAAIRAHTQQISFPAFDDFVYRVLHGNQRTPAEHAGIEQLDPRHELNMDRFLHRPPLGAHGLLRNRDYDYGCYIPGADQYTVLKTAAEVFLLLRCGTCPPAVHPAAGQSVTSDAQLGAAGGNGGDSDVFGSDAGEEVDLDALQRRLTHFLGTDRNSYIRAILSGVFRNEVRGGGFRESPFAPISVGLGPCLLELIWSYWMEEGMLVQTMNAISLRFQNVRMGRGRDPLAELEVDPLRPLSGFLWGYIQDEPHRLSLVRRAYEYSHHYGLSLYGQAVPRIRPADVRSRFLESFHDLLSLTARFYQEISDNTITPDPFPLLVALRDLHLILAEGAHNQFRDLPWTARVEMLVEQWLLARPEMRDFLRGRLMVPYEEPWMGAVDAMKRLQGWTDTNITHFRDLATFGEQLLLSVRYAAWNALGAADAQDWALVWRNEVQGYIHAYRMATGVNLTDDVVEVRRRADIRYRQPSEHLRSRLADERRQRRRLADGGPAASLTGDGAPRQLSAPAPGQSLGSVSITRTPA